MQTLQVVFQSILDMGAAVFLPIIIFVIGLIVGLKPGKAISAGLTLGVALTGINLVISYMSDTVGVAAQSFVENTGVQLTALDMGWAPALGLCWSWKYAFVMFPVQIGINVIMLILGWTKTLNVDMWNVGNKIFTAFIVSSVTGSAAAGFVVAIAQIILELKNGDATKNQITELTGVPGVSMPHPMFLSNIFFYPFAKLLDKIPFFRYELNAQTLKQKIGIFGENHVLGFIVGTIVGLIGGQGVGALLTGVQAGTALTLFPMVSKLFMTALTPMSIKEELKTMELSPMLRKIGMTLMSGIGGSSGVLYGSGYIAASKALKDVDVLDIESLYTMLKAELDAIMDRGKAQPGWKTMIDSLYEGLESYKKAVDEGEDEKGVMEALKLGAQQGRDHTKEMEAVKGRASYQTNKGVGELDPGAVTMCIQLECLSDYVINKAL